MEEVEEEQRPHPNRSRQLRRRQRDVPQVMPTAVSKQQGNAGNASIGLRRGQNLASYPEAGNFHPDFILWLVGEGDSQIVVFVDPKGIRNIGPEDPKIQFYAEIKKIQERLGDSDVQLESFIISNTPSHTMRMLWSMGKAAMQAKHVLFQEEDKDTYIKNMLESVAASTTV